MRPCSSTQYSQTRKKRDSFFIKTVLKSTASSTISVALEKTTRKQYVLKEKIKKTTVVGLLEKSNLLLFESDQDLLTKDIFHPNVIQLVDHFWDYSRKFPTLYLIYPYYEDGDLRKLIEKRKKDKNYFSETEVLRLFFLMLNGVRVLHDNCIIHRDLKTSNFFVENKEKGVNLVVADFGCSCTFDEKKDFQFCTPLYCPPEFIKKEDFDDKYDVWSLGVCFFEIITFFYPFRGKTVDEIFSRIVNSPPVFPEEIKKKYSKNLIILIEKMLEKNKKLRLTLYDCIENLKNLRKDDKTGLFSENYNYQVMQPQKEEKKYVNDLPKIIKKERVKKHNLHHSSNSIGNQDNLFNHSYKITSPPQRKPRIRRNKKEIVRRTYTNNKSSNIVRVNPISRIRNENVKKKKESLESVKETKKEEDRNKKKDRFLNYNCILNTWEVTIV